MSTDPNAILYYGIQLGDSDPVDDYHTANELWQDDRRPPQPADKSNYRTPEWEAWRERLKEWERSPENVEIAWWGTENCQRYCVHADSLLMRVEWDEQKEVPPDMLMKNYPEHDEWIRQFCERYGLPYSQPKWYLAAFYF